MHPVELVASTARSWLGTPWRHQAAMKGLGCDCVGLVRGVGVECGFMTDPVEEESRPFRGYSVVPHPPTMKRGLDLFLCRLPSIRDARQGDVLWFRIGGRPQHLGILVDNGGLMVHAAVGHGVIEHLIDPQKWAKLAVAAWRFPGIARD